MPNQNNEKKALLFIVEGLSDEAALGTIMKELFADSEVRFQPVHGDITTKDYVSKHEIVKKIDELLCSFMKTYGYQKSDIAKIIHLADTDGAFIPDRSVVAAPNRHALYYPDHIETRLTRDIKDRNHRKAAILQKLSMTRTIHDIPYEIYYNSCNLEHILYNELKDFSNRQKMEMSDDFAEKYDNHAKDFVKFISNPDFAVPGTYQESWEFISRQLHSLNRYSNLHQLFINSR